MTPEIQHLHANIEEIALEWASAFLHQRRAYLRSRKTDASGQLMRSLEAAIDRQARGDAVVLLLAFEDYGRYIDMKRLNTSEGGPEYIRSLVQWIRDKGMEQKMIAGWQRRHGGRAIPADVLNRIAWGIVKKRHQRPRRRQWWNKSKSAAISDLFNLVAASIPDEVIRQMRKDFKKG